MSSLRHTGGNTENTRDQLNDLLLTVPFCVLASASVSSMAW